MAEVFLHDKSYVFTWVLSTPNIKIKHQGTMKGKGKNYKKFSRFVEISSTLQQLRKVLLEKGHALQGLLDVQYSGADAVYSSVGEIHILIEHDDIFNVWVSAHVKVDNGKKIISNRDVHKVSVLLIASLVCMEDACAYSIFSLLR